MTDQRQDWPLVDPLDVGICPGKEPDRCFYCGQRVGEPHQRDCDVVKKVVRFRVTVDLDFTVPHSWSDERIRCEPYYEKVMSALESNDLVEYVGVVDDTPRPKLRTATNQ